MADARARVACVVVTYDAVPWIEQCLASVADIPQTVVVDNGSTDDTAAVGRRLAERLEPVRLLHLDEKGRGRALRRAWSETDAEFSIYMDVDLSTDLNAVAETVALLRQGADLVTGTRLHRNSTITRCLKREVLSRGYNRLIRWLLHTRARTSRFRQQIGRAHV